MRRIGNPRVLETSLDLLETLKGWIEKDGFDEENDKDVLTKVYGEYDPDNGSETLGIRIHIVLAPPTPIR
jgi:hypothetical protein